jgi:signal transduction histidine kinase
MEGLGTLAGGIAHDFNNILAIILGYTNRLETLTSQPATSGAIKIIKEAVERGAALVQQLLTSARQTEARFPARSERARQRARKNAASDVPKNDQLRAALAAGSSYDYCGSQSDSPGVC